MGVEPSLCVQGLERVFAMGDAVAVEGASRGDAPMTAQVAMQQAEFAAWNVWFSINGQPPVPFRYQHLGNMMGFGRDRGAVTLPLGEGLTLDGEVGGFVRKVAYLYRMPTNEQRLKIVSNLARKVGAAARAPGANDRIAAWRSLFRCVGKEAHRRPRRGCPGARGADHIVPPSPLFLTIPHSITRQRCC